MRKTALVFKIPSAVLSAELIYICVEDLGCFVLFH